MYCAYDIIMLTLEIRDKYVIMLFDHAVCQIVMLHNDMNKSHINIRILHKYHFSKGPSIGVTCKEFKQF